MAFAIVKNNAYINDVDQGVLIEWDSKHLCTVGALTEPEKLLFNVVRMTEVSPYGYVPFDKICVRDGAEFINGEWLMKWRLDTLSESEIIEKSLNIQASIISAVQARLDSFAQTKFYDGILSACTYATSSVPKFMLEGQYAVSARDATWSAANTILEAVIAGTRPVPSGYAEIKPELPVLSWPVVP